MNILEILNTTDFIEKYLDESQFPNGYKYSDIDEISLVEDDQVKSNEIDGVIEVSFIGNFRKRSEFIKHDEETTLWVDYTAQNTDTEYDFKITNYELKKTRSLFPDKILFLKSVKSVRSPKTLIKKEVEVIHIPPKYIIDDNNNKIVMESSNGLRFVTALLYYIDYYCVGVRWHSLNGLGTPQSTAKSTWMILPQEVGINLIEFYQKMNYGFVENDAQYFLDKLHSNKTIRIKD
ncbi:hypothetical protein ACT3CE_17580 [Marinifilum sp. RC60d5]|uniref:hypothetical protein n=1 Tax=Marinifilum sp. RC60d5 TaxID=3458414 RepID=UPI0040362FA7